MFKKSLVLVVLCAFLAAAVPAQNGFNYPKARRGDQVDNFHGTLVPDPYRWMEETESPETRAWIEAENKITFDYLGKIPQREAIKNRLTEIWNYERYSAPSKVTDGLYIYTKNDGLQNQSVLYRASSINDAGTVFFDPNKIREDGTAALGGSRFTDDGKLWAYGVHRPARPDRGMSGRVPVKDPLARNQRFGPGEGQLRLLLLELRTDGKRRRA
jgi:prolyl oligopeptidase